jgi:hypothetical protein
MPDLRVPLVLDDRWFRFGDCNRYPAIDWFALMANLITNKHKNQQHCERSNKIQKQQANRRIHKTQCGNDVERPSSVGNTDRLSKRKRPGNCPICLAKLERKNRMTRCVRKCSSCHVQFYLDLPCLRCITNRVWRGKS